VDLATLRRAVGKIRARPRPAVPSNAAAPSVRVKSPLMWPWFRRPFDRRLNRRALLWALSREVAQLPQPRIAVTTIPLVADLAGALPVDRWVYYCVDDLSTWPGLESAPLLAMERDLLPKMQAVISVSHVLQDRLRSLGRESSLISHGVDLDHWKTNRQGAPTTDAVPSAPLPRVVFWGLVDDRLQPSTNGCDAILGLCSPAPSRMTHCLPLPPAPQCSSCPIDACLPRKRCNR
jgi:hypothetical protein